MPKITKQDQQIRHANFSNVKFAKRFALLYRKHRLHNTFGRIRQINHFKFIKEMKQKYGYYTHQKSKIRASDKYYDRLKPSNWSRARIIEWGEKNANFFETITNVKRKTTRRKKILQIIPRLPKKKRKIKNTEKKTKNMQGICSLLTTITTVALVMHKKQENFC